MTLFEIRQLIGRDTGRVEETIYVLAKKGFVVKEGRFHMLTETGEKLAQNWITFIRSDLFTGELIESEVGQLKKLVE